LKRTQRLKINHVQNSENDVGVSPGFNVNIGKYISTIPPEGLTIPKHTLFFAEGYHRCAFLTANYKESRKYFSPQFKKVKVSSLRSEFEKLSKDYDLDFTRLSNEEFVSLLKHSASPEFQDGDVVDDEGDDERVIVVSVTESADDRVSPTIEAVLLLQGKTTGTTDKDDPINFERLEPPPHLAKRNTGKINSPGIKLDLGSVQRNTLPTESHWANNCYGSRSIQFSPCAVK